MSDAQIAQPPMKSDVPKIDFSHVIAQTWQAPNDLGARNFQSRPAQDMSNGYLDFGTSADLYGDKVKIAQGIKKPTESAEKAEPTVAKKPEQTELKVENHGASPKFAGEVEQGLKSLPEDVKRELAQHHVQIYVFKNRQDYDKAFGKHAQNQPDAGSLFNYSDPKHLRIAIFEEQPGGYKDQWHPPGGLARHEVGHAYDYLTGGQMTGALEQGFLKTLKDELSDMKTEDSYKFGLLQKKLGKGGILAHYNDPRELYAEMFSLVSGGGYGSDVPGDILLIRFLPKCIDYMKEHFKVQPWKLTPEKTNELLESMKKQLEKNPAH